MKIDKSKIPHLQLLLTDISGSLMNGLNHRCEQTGEILDQATSHQAEFSFTQCQGNLMGF